jgi:hypothetical protein
VKGTQSDKRKKLRRRGWKQTLILIKRKNKTRRYTYINLKHAHARTNTKTHNKILSD